MKIEDGPGFVDFFAQNATHRLDTPQSHGGTENERNKSTHGSHNPMCHRGLLESTYEAALCVELEDQGLKYQRQLTFPVLYRGRRIGEYRVDLIVEDSVVVEIKSVERFDPVFRAQVLTYLRVTAKKVGLLINFNSELLKDGVSRFIL